MFNKSDIRRDACMLRGGLARQGYDWWWHSFTARRRDNGEEKAFFIEFFLCNPALAAAEPVFGQLPHNQAQGRRPSYLMVKAGCWGRDARQLHRFFSWGETRVQMDAPYSVQAGDCYVDEKQLRGSISISPQQAQQNPHWLCQAGELCWDLQIDKQIAYNVGYGASAPLRFLQAFEMYWHAEGMKSAFSGTVTLDGIVYDVEPQTCYGYADKNWGKNFTSPWVWLSSNNLTSNISGKKLNNSVFDIGGGRPKIFFVALNRQLLSAFWYEGQPYEFNFSKFWTLTRTKFAYEETAEEILWHIRQETTRAVMETEARCFKRDMLLINYESPDGQQRHKQLWNGGNGTARILLYSKQGGKSHLVDDIAAANLGCEYGEYER